jgi:hypothetical protein
MKVGMIVFRDSTDEVTITLVSQDQYSRIQASFNEFNDEEDHINNVRNILDNEPTIERIHQQTFCMDAVNWDTYQIIGVHTLPDW